MKTGKLFIASFAAVLPLISSASLANGASFAPTATQWTIVAQNPNNDPDVQRGINQRNEQERQRQIQACVSRAEAGMNPAAAAQQDNDIRRTCTQGVPYSMIRG